MIGNLEKFKIYLYNEYSHTCISFIVLNLFIKILNHYKFSLIFPISCRILRRESILFFWLTLQAEYYSTNYEFEELTAERAKTQTKH